MAAIDTITGLANLVGAVKGKSSNTTQTTTTKKDYDQDAVNNIVRKLTSGQGGQAAISGRARGAGLYNSSTEQQLLNDLNSRVAGEVAERTAGTTQTANTQIEQPGISLGDLAAPLAIGAIGKPIVESLLGLGNSASAASAASGIANLTGSVGSMVSNVAGEGLSGIADVAGLGLGGSPLASALPGIGGVAGSIASLFGEGEPNPLQFFSGPLAAVLAGSGPIGAIAAPIIGVLGSLFGGGGGSVICTALTARGLLNTKLYLAGSDYISNLNPYTRVGYQIWGRKVAKQINRGNKLAIALSLPFARSRTSLIASSGGLFNHLRYPLGTVTKYIGEPVCYLIGRTVAYKRGVTYGTV